MTYQEILPDPRLRELVRVYWQMEDVHFPQQEEHRFMPERSVCLTFSAGQSWQGPLYGAELERMPAATLAGLTLEPLRVVSHGLTRAFGVELFPWGARQLFGWSAEQRDLDLSQHFPLEAATVCALVTLGDWPGAHQAAESWLLRLWHERAAELGKGARAAAELYRSLGTARLGTLAEELNVSQRQLERYFAVQVGVNAKTLARLIRFEEVHNRLSANPGISLAPLAYELGFADQAHLSRDFKALAHMTPGAFARLAQVRLRLPLIRF